MSSSTELAAAQPTAEAAASLREIEWRPRYSTSRDDLATAFYVPALERAVSYDRAVGFFRSSIFTLVGAATANFALREGRLRVLCSPELYEDDVRAIERGAEVEHVLDTAARRELERVLEYPGGAKSVDLLAALLAHKTLELRFIVRDRGRGMYHDKFGVFRDARGDAISFAGSANESWNAWHSQGNHESFEVFASWTQDSSRVRSHFEEFDRLWDGVEPGLSAHTPSEAFSRDLIQRVPDEPGDHLKRIAKKHGPRPKQLFDHQLQALRSWEASDYRGLLKHATGSGKTITALAACRRWLEDSRAALIIVPSVLLLNQWRAEIDAELKDLDISVLAAGGGNDDWRRQGLLRLHTEARPSPRMTVATVQTAATQEFLSSVAGGDHLLLIADEVHRMGAHTFRRVLTVDSAGRLGLSATPERAGDPVGTQLVFEYFGDLLEPVFTLRDAIATGRIVPYEYHIHLTSLSDEEQDRWLALTDRIAQAIARETKDGQPPAFAGLSSAVKLLLIQRARVLKKAGEKVPTAVEVVTDGWREGQHWLVYCDDREQLADVRERLAEEGLGSFEYHSAMESHAATTLDRYRRDGGILVAIRCLDEGVDIPWISHAVVLASSRNPREFVQRRGRVLRRAPRKTRAVIHDLLVQPPGTEGRDSPFRALAYAELARAIVFAEDAVNLGASAYLRGLCADWDISWDEIVSAGTEAEDEGEAE
jgi:superfamily II DNA or RNA helicase